MMLHLGGHLLAEPGQLLLNGGDDAGLERIELIRHLASFLVGMVFEAVVRSWYRAGVESVFTAGGTRRRCIDGP